MALGRSCSIQAAPEQSRFLIEGLHCSIQKVRNALEKSGGGGRGDGNWSFELGQILSLYMIHTVLRYHFSMGLNVVFNSLTLTWNKVLCVWASLRTLN